MTVSDAGIRLAGPEASLELTADELSTLVGRSSTFFSGLATVLTSGTSVSVTSGSTTSVVAGEGIGLETAGDAVVNSPEVTLGGPSGCSPAARKNDPVSGGFIRAGSSNVFAC